MILYKRTLLEDTLKKLRGQSEDRVFAVVTLLVSWWYKDEMFGFSLHLNIDAHHAQMDTRIIYDRLMVQKQTIEVRPDVLQLPW